LAILTGEGELIAARDPLGIRPLSLGRVDGGYVIASETSVLDSIGAKLIRDVEPGEVILIDKEGLQTRLVEAGEHAHCMFEWVYFARPDSFLEGVSTHEVRARLGRNLAKEHPVEGDIVVPVPDSGRSAASGYAIESGMPLFEGFIKNRYLGRTFIMPNQDEREEHLKFNPIKTVVSGKSVVLVDDSIVRGTTLPKLVELLRRAGAREVHVRISCPPIRSPCFYGIDFPTFEELMAFGRSPEEIREKVKADTLFYQSIDGLIDAIGLPREELCMACLTGEYPTRSGLVVLEQLREMCEI
jgi:amidophosphoribosyltransferase